MISLMTACIAAALAADADRGRYVEVAPPEARRGRWVAPIESRPFHLIQASAAIGEVVRDAKGEQLGVIRELAFDARRHRMVCAFIDLREPIGSEGKIYPVPWQALAEPREQEDAGETLTFTLKTDPERLARAEGYKPGQWPDLTDWRWAREAYRLHGLEPYWESSRTLRGEPISQSPRSRSVRSAQRVWSQPPQPLVLRTNNEMMGHPVQHASNGEVLGVLSDLLIDRNSGDVAFVVVTLDPGSSVMRTERHKDQVALPTAMFAFDRSGRRPDAPYVIQCCLEKLRLHRFSMEEWPDLRSRSWAQNLYADFGRVPYWQQH